MKTKLHFSRFEFKYILNQARRDALEDELRHFMAFDPFVQRQPDHRYFVRSLYFDDPQYGAYFEKIDGIKTRKKYRVRTYTDNRGACKVVFLEVKGRHNQMVYKHRAPLPLDALDWIEGGSVHLAERLAAHRPEESLFQEFLYDAVRNGLRPTALIDYMRRPYVSPYDHNFRVTFDESLRGTITNRMFPGENQRSRRVLPGFSIIEVKFSRHLPAWFHRIIQSHELWRVSVSKYCRGMEACGMVDNLE